MKRIAAVLALALLIPACMHKSEMEGRWDGIDGRKVVLLDGYEKIVHASAECPSLKTARGTQVPCKVKDGRLVGEDGLFLTGPDARPALCICVK